MSKAAKSKIQKQSMDEVEKRYDKLTASGHYWEAAAMVGEAIKAYPNEPDPRLWHGIAMAQAGKEALAIKSFQDGIVLDDHDSRFYYNLGVLLDEMGRSKDAIKAYKNALALSPDDSDSRGNLAELYQDTGRYDLSIPLLCELLRDPEANPFWHVALGKAYAKIGQIELALESFHNATEVMEKCNEAWWRIGVIHYYNEDYDLAVIAYRNSLRHDPEDSAILRNLGTALDMLDRYEEAEPYFRQSIALAPSDAGVYNDLGVCLKLQERYGEAIVAYKTAILLHPSLEFCHRNLGNCYYDLKQFKAALRCYNAELALHKRDAPAHYLSAKAYFRIGQLKRSYAAAMKAIKLRDPEVTPDTKILIRDLKRRKRKS
jgi:tetratricopeptide (TPR) repeat protein